MKKKSFAIAVLTIVVLAACTNSSKKPASTMNAEDTKMASIPAAKTTDFKPFDVMEINHTVKDYALWKKAFDMDSVARKASGLGFLALGKSLDNPNYVSIAFSAADVQKAKAFAADPRLKDVMEKNGVTSKPDITFWHVIKANLDSKEKNWVLITHKVKDFDAWLKVYDGEGTATRATYGLVDVVLARGIDDPNLVHIVFDINDMAKAKNRINDPALKKLMMDGGVEGAPKIEFYSMAE
jgi:hypothetical protein